MDPEFKAMWARIQEGYDRQEREEAERMKDPAYRAAREAAEAERVALERASLLQERRKTLGQRGVPAKDHEALLSESGPRETKAIRVTREWMLSPQTVLVLSGTRGCGKTVAAGWAVSEGRGGSRFLDVTKLQRLSRYDDDRMSEFEEAPLLAIDDLGMEFSDAKGSFAALFDGLFNTRYAEARRTLITTNLSAALFRERYGERVADRIREVGKYVELDEQSLRGRP